MRVLPDGAHEEAHLLCPDLEAPPPQVNLHRKADDRAPQVIGLAEVDDLPLALVLVGHVGVGKSSTANSILGSQVNPEFVTKRSAASVTQACQAAEATLGGHRLLILDTPGLGSITNSEDETWTMIRNGISDNLLAGTPLCVVLVFSLENRVGQDDVNMVLKLQERVFGHGMLLSSLIVWTHGDSLAPDLHFEEFIEGVDQQVVDLLKQVSGGSLTIDNTQQRSGTSEGNIDPQVSAIIEKATEIARPWVLAKEKLAGIGGRKAARRKRQVERGLIRIPERADTQPSCSIS